MTLNDLILLAALLLLAGCCLLPRLGDLPRTRRARQFWMPAAALLYSVLALRFLDPAASLIVSLFGRFPSLAGFPLTMLLPVLSGMVLLILYLPVKLILTRILSGLFCRCRPLYEAVAGRFYEKSEDYEGEFLKDRWGQLRSLLRGLQLALVLMTTAILGLSVKRQLFSAYRYPLYPVLATLMLGEIVSFLSGLMLSEYEEQVLGMGESARRTGSFARLRKIYRELFADRLLCDESSERQPDMESGSSLVRQLQQSGEPEEQALGGYFDRLLSSGVRLDETRMLSSRDLLQGRSVLYADPFYRDLTPYLVFVFCRTLVRGGKLLVVTGRPESAPETARWLTEALGEASGAPTLWQVGPLSPDPELDVGVLSAAQLYDRELQSRCEEFLQQVRFVLLVEPSRLTAAGQIGLKLLLSRCGGEEKPVYAACDRNQDGLVDALSHLLEVSLTEVVSTDMPACSVTSMFWQADGEQLHHRILEGVARCLGTGTELAAVALKNQVEQVSWFGSSRAPLLDLRWLAGQYARPICDYTGVYPSQHWLEEAIRFCPDLWGQKREKRLFAVVEDEFDNLFEMSRQFATRGEEQVFLHILSGRYLLRDYMCA
ncbi:MAG: hypothetical protein PUC47_13325, partial [Oscillospiraceae bacterium]|nr:hypothetical protein [Oscillospiraceae bacterium]